eukprot:6198658-Pleurochrysis_carterae.AAC.2
MGLTLNQTSELIGISAIPLAAASLAVRAVASAVAAAVTVVAALIPHPCYAQPLAELTPGRGHTLRADSQR